MNPITPEAVKVPMTLAVPNTCPFPHYSGGARPRQPQRQQGTCHPRKYWKQLPPTQQHPQLQWQQQSTRDPGGTSSDKEGTCDTSGRGDEGWNVLALKYSRSQLRKEKTKLVIYLYLLENKRKVSTYQPVELLKSK